MKPTKHILLTIAMLLCSLTAGAEDFSVDGIYYNITSSTDLTVAVTYRGSSADRYSNEYTGAVTIPSTVTYNSKIYKVTSIGKAAFSGCSSLTSITIPESVTSIGEFAFGICSGLTSITIPDNSQLTSIGECAFEYCSSLTSITIPEGVTSIGDEAFEDCSSLTSITIPEGVTSIGNDAFRNCSSLTSITLPENSKLTSIGDEAFYNCSSLTAITIPEGVTSIGEYAFYKCSSLTSITIPEGVTSIGNYAFQSCIRLTSITLPESVTSIGSNAFAYCGSLTSITLPESVTSIGSNAFAYCSSLNGAFISAETPPTIGTSVFYDKYIYLYVPASSVEAYKSAEGWSGYNNIQSTDLIRVDGIWYEFITKAKIAKVSTPTGIKYAGSISIPATVTYEGVTYSVTSIGDYAFYKCSSLAAITIPEGVTSIGDEAFDGCSSLTAITIPEGVTSIGKYAFYNCSSLTSITIPESVTSIGSMAFYNCSRLASITLPEGVTSIGERAFYGCSSLTSITLPESVTSIGYGAFEDCSSLTSITIPESVTSIVAGAFSGCSILTSITIPASVTSIGSNAFYGCRSLTGITIPESVTSIGEKAFYNCSSLTAITIPKSVTKIGSSAFFGCTGELIVNCNIPSASSSSYGVFYRAKFTKVTIGDSVTSIGEYAFYNCSSLTSIVLPEKLKSVGSKAFANCTELLDVYCYAESVPSASSDAFDGSYPEYITLHVPTSALESYKSTTPWSSFGTITALKSVVAITLSQSSATLHEGKSLTLGATVSPDDADDKTVTWSSSDENIATVDAEGKVTAIAVGNATITATAKDGSGVTASCEVTVVPAVYAITFLIDGEVVATDTLTRGSTITLPEAPAKEGYTFSGWGEVPETMPAEDVTIEGVFVANKYLVTFKVDGEVVASDSLEYNSAIVVPEVPVKEGHTFSGWSGVAETVPAHDVIYEGGYTINSYLLTYSVDGETLLSMPVVYGGGIPILNVPAKEGYTFSGWGNVPETMPAEDVTIEGVFVANKYLVTFKVDGEVVASDSLEYNSAIVVPEAPVKEGHTFSGWSGVAETVPAHDVIYEGGYTINSYLLTYSVDGETLLSMPVVYGGGIPTLNVPAKEGYTFSGWGEVPETMPAEDVAIEGVFAKLPSICLTISQADNGCVKQHLTVGSVCTYTIEAAEGWKIHTVTLNGEDVTSQLTEEGTFTTPALQEDAVLNISYEQIDGNEVKSARANAIKVSGYEGIITVDGCAEGEGITIYTTDGAMVAQQTAESASTRITVATDQMYIVKVADKVVKILM